MTRMITESKPNARQLRTEGIKICGEARCKHSNDPRVQDRPWGFDPAPKPAGRGSDIITHLSPSASTKS